MLAPELQKLEQFFNEFKPQKYKKRTMILHANDVSSSVFYIKSGYVRVFRISEQGEELTLTILKPNDFFPLTYGINQTTNPYYLETITSLELVKAPVDHFLLFIRSNPEVYFELTNRIMIRFDGVLSRMEYLVFSNAYTKVAATLLICGQRFGEKRNGNEILLSVPLTHKDIATLVGITRETTSLEMKKLENQGYITRNGRFILIRDCKKLEEDILLTTEEGSPLSYSL